MNSLAIALENIERDILKRLLNNLFSLAEVNPILKGMRSETLEAELALATKIMGELTEKELQYYVGF